VFMAIKVDDVRSLRLQLGSRRSCRSAGNERWYHEADKYKHSAH